MDTLLAERPAARTTAIDTLFSTQSLIKSQGIKAEIALRETDDGEGRSGKGASASAGGFGMRGIDLSKINVDINSTQGINRGGQPRNITLASANLLTRIALSNESLWRNPVRTRITKWSGGELMHIFNGYFHQAIDEYEHYETFGKCYTSPDPFRNDDPPWKPSFCK